MTIHLSNVVASQPQSAGDACTLRAFLHTDFSHSPSPVVMVEHFIMNRTMAAPPQPHAGLCMATLLLEDANGVMRCKDSPGSVLEARAGDLHWTVAGAGILTTQQLVGPGHLNGLRIGLNLPDRLKSLSPAVSLLRAWEMPVIQTDAGRVRVVAGNHGGWQSPLATPEALMILDGWLRPGATQLLPLPPGWNAWVYSVQGELGVRARHRLSGAPPLPKRQGGDPDFAVLPAGAALAASAPLADDEGVLLLMAGKAPVHYVLTAGPAVDEPVFRHGAVVMASQRALTRALAAYEAGEFGQMPQGQAA
ncbi:pirin-like C-terminal cupin domain-containing protein [Achromobacter marplatensis]|uniref:pirin-like C-terminal cupin domain-containing protein n=1 Tax=Achromobacter marplatensis TaxID=470868 RepID=UPI0039F64C7D